MSKCIGVIRRNECVECVCEYTWSLGRAGVRNTHNKRGVNHSKKSRTHFQKSQKSHKKTQKVTKKSQRSQKVTKSHGKVKKSHVKSPLDNKRVLQTGVK